VIEQEVKKEIGLINAGNVENKVKILKIALNVNHDGEEFE